LPRFLRRNVVIIRAASAIPVCRMQLFSRPQRQRLQHRHMGNREADHEELTATGLSAPHLHCTHQQLLQYTALLPRARPIEAKAPLRDQGRCKPSCAVCLSLYCLLLTVGLFCLPKNLDLIVAIYFEAN
jgi:hypothetical protein